MLGPGKSADELLRGCGYQQSTSVISVRSDNKTRNDSEAAEFSHWEDGGTAISRDFKIDLRYSGISLRVLT